MPTGSLFSLCGPSDAFSVFSWDLSLDIICWLGGKVEVDLRQAPAALQGRDLSVIFQQGTALAFNKRKWDTL